MINLNVTNVTNHVTINQQFNNQQINQQFNQHVNIYNNQETLATNDQIIDQIARD